MTNNFEALVTDAVSFLKDLDAVVPDVVPSELVSFLQSTLGNETSLKLLFNSLALKKTGKASR